MSVQSSKSVPNLQSFLWISKGILFPERASRISFNGRSYFFTQMPKHIDTTVNKLGDIDAD